MAYIIPLLGRKINAVPPFTRKVAEDNREPIHRVLPCPCDSCQRWSECNGVAAESCPLFQNWEEREKQRQELAALLELEDKTESGLFEED